jgi:hypothetical protein
VRIGARWTWAAILAAGVCAASSPAAPAQQDQSEGQQTEILMPEQSAAKAKQIIQDGIAALGGSAYLNEKDVTCTGTFSNFGHSGELSGFTKFEDFEIFPDKDRFENVPKHNIISVYNGDKGWTLDRGGVSEAAATDVADWEEGLKTDLNNLLRNRIHEKSMIFRYLGPDTVDRLEVDWVELVDSENRTIHIAFSKTTHLPIRKTVETRNPNTQMKSEEVEYYSLYHPIDGIMTPFQIARDRNGLKYYQVFFDKCDYNTGLSDSFFTRESLEDRWAKVGKKSKNKKEKEKDRD